MVYFAVENNTVLATCMTMKTETNTWEICKLASNKNVNHKGAGSAVVKAGTEYAIKQGAKKLIIVSNTILKPALHIYKNSDLKKYPWMKHIIINALIFSLNTL